MASEIARARIDLLDYALGFPGAYEDHPWGETVVKVNKKIFVFLGCEDPQGGMGISAKLPTSGADAMELPFAKPTGYGLGKSGWVSARFEFGDRPPVDLLKRWIDESFRAVAPKRAVAQLDGASGASGRAGARRVGRARRT
jgi:predicted DNA-binding protein (MmcQ/YjbR family)